MPKHEPLTPKAIANHIKSKGLQKLKWYCQMCQKQCRDENGYKCHTSSEGHQRQMLIYGENSSGFMSTFTRDFEAGYLDHLRRMHGTKRTFANLVYQEYIKDRDHIHMNATKWETLTDFVQYLGKTGKCIVDLTERGWYVTYIDRDPETLARQAKLKRLERKEMDDEERMQLAIERMMERGSGKTDSINGGLTTTDEAETSEASATPGAPLEFKRPEDEKISVGLVIKPKPAIFVSIDNDSAPSKTIASVFKKPLSKTKHGEEEVSLKSMHSSVEKISSLLSADDSNVINFGRGEKRVASEARNAGNDVRLGSSSKKSKKSHRESDNKPPKALVQTGDDAPWLVRGIVVKLITNDLGAAYFKRKAVVKEVLADDPYTAIVQLEDGEYAEARQRIKIDQTHVETVIPKPGRPVLFVRGKYRGEEAEMVDINYDKFCVTIKLKTVRSSGKVVDDVAYDQVCKLA